MERLQALQACVESNDADALILTFLPDIRWLTGFSGSNALVLFTNRKSFFITDGRYATQSRNEVKADEIHVASGNLMRHAVDQKILEGSKRVIVQAEHVTLSTLEEYKKIVGDEKEKMVAVRFHATYCKVSQR